MFMNAFEFLGGGPAALAILLALIALCGAIGGAVTSYSIAGRAVYVNSITAERSKWIDKLRTNLATYSGLLAELSFKLLLLKKEQHQEAAAGEILALLKHIKDVVSLIQLQLNPWGVIDRNILLLLENIVVRLDSEPTLIDKADKLLIAHSQWLLKAEWEKVKFEARGPVHRLLNRTTADERLCEYRHWAALGGCLDGIVDEFKHKKT